MNDVECQQKIERLEQSWRELLCLHHGCDQRNLYLDDGELQCGAEKHLPFWIDFRRDSVELIKWKLANDEYKRLIPIPLNNPYGHTTKKEEE